MRYFIDTEFSARGAAYPVDMISIAMVAEDGRELYLLNASFNPKIATPFVRDHVLPHLPPRLGWPVELFPLHSRNYVKPKEARDRVRQFIGDDPSPEFWGYYCAYDYVVLSQLIGGMDDWPEGWPFYMRDLRQWLDERGLQGVSQPDDAPHNALEDARWIRETFDRYVREEER